MQRLFSVLFGILFAIAVGAADLPYINPTPQNISYEGKTIQKPQSVRLVLSNNFDKPTEAILSQLFEVSFSRKAYSVEVGTVADRNLRRYRKFVPNHSEAYYLSITANKLVVVGSDERGMYYGVRTLELLMQGNQLPLVTITDFPDIKDRGVVEGFYGDPWTLENRLSQLKFYGKYKMNTYIYGPKDDPYHRSPNWRVPYPQQEAQAIVQLVKEAKANHVDFVWAIHPGVDIKWNDADRDALIRKFEAMYDLGVRRFAVFFDDISGEGTKADKQAELLNYIDNTFIKPKKDVKPLILCPTEYNKSWSNIERGYLPTLGNTLNPSIEVMWTGDWVISDITVDGLNWINNHIKRKAYIWWNYPVSDYVRDHLLMGPSYGLDTKADNLMAGFMTNPMEYAESSKVAIYSVADYAWNIGAYDDKRSWDEALKAVLPNHAVAFRQFAIHSADLGPNGHNYRRDESWEFKPTAAAYLSELKTGKVSNETTQNVLGEFVKLRTAASELLASTDNPTLIKEMTPWLTQARVLGEMGMLLPSFDMAVEGKNRELFDNLYTNMKQLKQEMYDNNNTLNQNPFQPGAEVGTLVLQPLVDSAVQHYAKRYEQMYGVALAPITNYTPHQLFSNVAQIQNSPVRYLHKAITITPLLEVVKVQPLGYYGIEMIPQQTIQQTRIDFGSDQFPAWAVVQVSEDGENWITYEGKMNDRKMWIGGALQTPFSYIRVVNTSGNTQECFVRRFEVKVK